MASIYLRRDPENIKALGERPYVLSIFRVDIDLFRQQSAAKRYWHRRESLFIHRYCVYTPPTPLEARVRGFPAAPLQPSEPHD